LRYLAVCLALAVPAAAQADVDSGKPTAWTAKVQDVESVPKLSMAPVDVEALKAEDAVYAQSGEKALRYAATLKVNVTPAEDGTWERIDGDWLLWRVRIHSDGAKSLNFGFSEYFMPSRGRLYIYSLDGKHSYRAFTAEDNDDHGQLWTPPVFGPETVLEVTIPESQRDQLRLRMGVVNHDYRGFGRADMEKSGACNIDTVCPISDTYNDQERAVGVISTGGSRFCSGSLVNNTANDARPFFMTAAHCGIGSGNAASLVVFWNYYNSTCRPQGGGSSPPGDGSLSQFNTGSFHRASFAGSDVTLVELDDAIPPAVNAFFAGWDRTPNPTQFTSTVAIHHPNVEEKRITFAPGATESGGWPPSVPGDGSHIHAIWGTNLGVTEGGSSGSPLYTTQGRYIGQLHGGPSFCGAGDLSDYYGRFSVSWTGGGTDSTRLSNWLDAGNTGQITLDGRNGCVAPAAPAALSATATAPNTIQLTWNSVPSASGYNVYRATGACPQTSYSLIAPNVSGTSYTNTGVSGGVTYAYVVKAIVAGCESLASSCDDAVATGACTLAPAFAGLTSVTNGGTGACTLNLAWSAGSTICPSTTMKYNVYRSTTPGFTPGAANLRQSCVDGTTFADTTVSSGTSYYYVVRGEDSVTGQGGLCNGGNEETNTVQKSGAAFGNTSATITDNLEGGPAYWKTDGGTGSNVWTLVDNESHSPTHSFFVADPDVVTDQRLTVVSPATIPANFTMSWWHLYNVEVSTQQGLGFDGYVLEYSLDGTTWTDILDAQGTIPANANRFTMSPYTHTISDDYDNPLANRRAWSGEITGFQQVQVNLADFSGRTAAFRFRFGSDLSVDDEGVYIDDITFRGPGACSAGGAVPFGLVVDGGGNGVLEPGEAARIVAPRWSNTGPTPQPLAGVLSNFTGPKGGIYTINDNTGNYGTIPAGGNQSCTDCYSVTVAIDEERPSQHWETAAVETVSTTAMKIWVLHVGGSFSDVPASNPFYRFVEILLHKGITSGCGEDEYCPSDVTTREQMAAFMIVAKDGPGNPPPACAPPNIFADVSETSGFCPFIEELSRRGVVGGCGGGLYCPTSPVTRDAMAVFVLRTLDPTLNPPACGTPIFADVPASNPFCRWIEELARRNVVTGCGGGNYCPTQGVTREQMGVFISATFGFTLYGL
jgi:lysyl endopeptidase